MDRAGEAGGGVRGTPGTGRRGTVMVFRFCTSCRDDSADGGDFGEFPGLREVSFDQLNHTQQHRDG